MRDFASVAVYCGSNLGQDTAFKAAANEIGRAIARLPARLVYGGGRGGLMGVVADAALQEDGEVVGVIPTFLRAGERAHTGINELIETPDMATRRTKMIALSDAFIALPGGLGTYEELFEVFSGAQLQLHDKPIGLLNVNHFFDPLLHMIEQTIAAGFMPCHNLSLISVATDAKTLLQLMQNHTAHHANKWLTP